MKQFCITLLLVGWLAGCATTQVDWDRQVGEMTFDQAVDFLGPPDKSEKLDNGRIVAEWISRYGQTAPTSSDNDFRYQSASDSLNRKPRPTEESILRLTFGTNNILADWSKN
jgi:hypothetical protein